MAVCAVITMQREVRSEEEQRRGALEQKGGTWKPGRGARTRRCRLPPLVQLMVPFYTSISRPETRIPLALANFFRIRHRPCCVVILSASQSRRLTSFFGCINHAFLLAHRRVRNLETRSSWGSDHHHSQMVYSFRAPPAIHASIFTHSRTT